METEEAIIAVDPEPLSDAFDETDLLKDEINKTKGRNCCYRHCCVHSKSSVEDKEAEVKATLRELSVYLLFMVVLCILVFSSTSVTMYHYTKIVTNLFVNEKTGSNMSFVNIAEVEDFWTFALGPLLNQLYWDKWYNNFDLKKYNLSGYVYYENKLLGLPRLRQLRVESSKCLVSNDFKLYIQPCYDVYSQAKEDKNPFGVGLENPNKSAWVYKTSEEVDGFWFWGKLASYSGSGFIQDLPLKREDAKKILIDLRDALWIQRGTRAVFITFTIYNANLNLFSLVRLVVEFPATGGAVPSWSISSMRLIERESDIHFLKGVQWLFVTFIAGYTLQQFYRMHFQRLLYLKSVWNLVDILLIFLSSASVFTYIACNQMSKEKVLEFLKEEKSQYTDFVSVGFWMEASLSLHAATSFISFVKVFKYIGFNKTMLQLSMTLSTCAKDLAGFFIMFFIVFLAFTQLGYLLFGSQLQDFSSFISSFYTLFRIILGDFNFHQLEQANSFLGPIFFMLFVFFVFFVLINMFLAIINDTYSEIKSDVEKRAEMYIMSDYLKKIYNNTIAKLSASHDKVKQLNLSIMSDKVPEKTNLESVTFEEWKLRLNREGYTDEEIIPVFEQFDIDGDKILVAEEQSRMMETIHMYKAKKTAEEERQREEDTQSNEDEFATVYLVQQDYLDMTRRVERMEQSMKKLVFNIEEVAKHLQRLSIGNKD